jgi:hypothetical protein
VGGTVLLADVRLDLDDPAPAAGSVGRFVDEACAKEGRRDREGRPLEQGADLGQERARNICWRSPGRSRPKTFMKPGIKRERMSSAVNDVL